MRTVEARLLFCLGDAQVTGRHSGASLFAKKAPPDGIIAWQVGSAKIVIGDSLGLGCEQRHRAGAQFISFGSLRKE
jgi:hypothetical protein